MKFVSLLLLLTLTVSCNKNSVKIENIEKEITRFSKLKDNQLTKINIPSIIELDTIENDMKKITIKISNVGKVNLNPLIVRFHCQCVSSPIYDSILKPNETRLINVDFPIDKKGNFSYPIWVYGNFYPYIKTIYVEGYRK